MSNNYGNDFSDDYKKVVAAHKLLTREQERKLLTKIVNRSHYHKDDVAKAMDTLVYSNQRMVLKMAYKYHFKYPNIGLLDLVACGNIGLMKSILSFDLSFHTKLSSYAVPGILHSMGYFILNNHSIVVDRSNMQGGLRDAHFPKVLSLDCHVSGDNGDEEMTFKDTIEDENAQTTSARRMIVSTFNEVMGLISEDERQILRYAYVESYTLRQMGKIYHVSRETIRHRLIKIIKKIKLRVNAPPKADKNLCEKFGFAKRYR